MGEDWRGELERWLAPFVAALRHKTRGRVCPIYIAGLIGPGDRKSVQPMAARDPDVSYDGCIILLPAASGTKPRCRLRCLPKPTGWAAGTTLG